MLNLRWLTYAVLDRKPLPRRRKQRRAPPRSWKYKAFVRTHPCLVCNSSPVHAAHTGSDGGMSMKSSDFSVVPLCASHHMEFDAGRKKFQKKYGVSVSRAVKALNAEWKGEK